ncbi:MULTISPECIES: cupin domain-containing protein [unclassified Ruegeria]|uniref:cupin domain-containing protein n=1 Tax=unclassified Ruegeria TaxID=2625375 RepID=UPI001ADD44F9|nr:MULTISPECIES: cupin domain-containing protein [unclassified Ruegeria]MBO9413524.1 hypothetical protein [Ruegeria sp. R8_1]MBO9417293.1 hypothetical protein [Ruegeria sp. R8_2]
MTVEVYTSKPEGMIPNSRFPLLIHRGAIPGGGVDGVKARFRANGWGNNWEYPGVYEYPHFHSTSHECLGCAQGWMEFNLSVEGWTRVRIEAGDVIVMPAGVSHEMVGRSDDIMMCGGYAGGRDWDNIQEAFLTPEMFQAAAKRIMMLPIPDKDPATGVILHQWHDAPSSVDGGWNDFRDGLDASA